MKVLIVGLGSIARKHIRVLTELTTNIEIYALRSGKILHNESNVVNINKLQDLPGVPDFAIISNPTYQHSQTILELISFKCPLFIEKPVLDNLKESDALAETLKSNQIKTYVACNMRFHPCVTYLKQLFIKEEKRINEVNVYCGSYLPDWRPGTDYRTNYSAIKEMGGGVHLDLIHELDYIFWFFGAPIQVVKTLRSVSTLEISAIDYANYQLLYPEFSVNVILNYYRRESKRSIEVLFEDETLEADLLNFKIKKNRETIFETPVDLLETYKQQMIYFLDTRKHGKDNMNSFNEALEVLKICLA